MALLVCCWPVALDAQAAAHLPFFPGEELTYRVQVSKVGTVGEGTLSVEKGAELRGHDPYVLRFELETRVAFARAVDRTASWLDPVEMASLRYHKHERHPLSSRDQRVEIFPEQRLWTADDGSAGRSPTDRPLDELSFLYFVRTLPLEPGAEYRFDRHFEMDRNPVTVRVLGRERVSVGAGEFAAVLVEMRVRDPRRYGAEEGVLRIYLSDGPCRLPLRIESAMPVLGKTVLTLEGHTHPAAHSLARRP